MSNRAVRVAALGALFVLVVLAASGECAVAAAAMASHPARMTGHSDAGLLRQVQLRRCAQSKSVRVGYRCLERFRGRCIRGEPIYEVVCLRYY